MRSEPLESQSSQYEDDAGDNPKVKSERYIFPEPVVVDHAVSIPFDDVVDRVEFDEPLVLLGNQLH